MSLRQLMVTGALVVLGSSCSLGDPEDNASLNVFVAVDKSTLPTGESMTITVTARNVGYDALTLTGPADCLTFVDVLDSQGTVVWNSSGQCGGATVTEELAPGENYTESIVWSGSNEAGARLGAGYYLIRPVARLTGAPYAGPAITVALEGSFAVVGRPAGAVARGGR
ncbi:MAG TPA: hypothetical protein VFZ73_19505 [Gemmatimonadaceae bacterium]